MFGEKLRKGIVQRTNGEEGDDWKKTKQNDLMAEGEEILQTFAEKDTEQEPRQEEKKMFTDVAEDWKDRYYKSGLQTANFESTAKDWRRSSRKFRDKTRRDLWNEGRTFQ